VYKSLVRKPEGKSHLEDQGADGKIVLEWILRLRIGPDGGLW
jgi:hypothetical protein